MIRFLAGAAAAALLITASLFLWRAQADRGGAAIPAPPAMAGADAPMGIADLAGPPAATERTREEKRFARYDKDRNGAVSMEEYLANRRKGFAKLDTNSDGRLSFEEYAVKTSTKFAGADRDHNGVLNAAEFATTRVVRKAKPACRCAPIPHGPVPEAAPAEDDQG